MLFPLFFKNFLEDQNKGKILILRIVDNSPRTSNFDVIYLNANN
jgi:hypothetical protein